MKNFLIYLFILSLFCFSWNLNADGEKKIKVYPLLAGQGISKELATKESDKILRALQGLGLQIISEQPDKKYPDTIPSFKKLSSETKSLGGDYFIWGSAKAIGDGSYRILYIVDANTSKAVNEIALECLDLSCDLEEMKAFQEKVKIFLESNSISTKETGIPLIQDNLSDAERKERNLDKAKRSFYFPGLGQAAFKKDTKAFLFAVSFLFTLWIGRDQNIYSHQISQQSRDFYAGAAIANYLNLPLPVFLLGIYKGSALENDSREYGYSSHSWYFIAASIYVFNIVDAFYISSDTRFQFQISPSTSKHPYEKNYSGFSFSFKKEFDL